LFTAGGKANRKLSAISDDSDSPSDTSDEESDDSDDEIVVGRYIPRRQDPLEPVLDRGLFLGQLAGFGEPSTSTSSKPITTQYLYIQMEFCEGQTLREAIDNKVWSCFALKLPGASF
jgi:hypothetical protein